MSTPIYISEIRHKGPSYPGQHTAISHNMWERAAKRLRQRNGRFGVGSTGSAPSLLIGKLFDERGEGLTPTHTKKGNAAIVTRDWPFWTLPIPLAIEKS